MGRRITWMSIGTAAALAVAGIASGAPPANAAFTPNKSSAIDVSVDGLTVGIDDSVEDMSGVRQGVFGGGATPPSGSNPGTGELTEMYPARSGEFINFEARGGVIDGSASLSCGSSVIYRRARITLTDVPTGARVWALYDSTINPSGGPSGATPHFNSPTDRITSTTNLEKLCDNTTTFVDGTAGTMTLGSGGASRTTAGMYKDVSTGTTVSFDVYVPTFMTAVGGATNLIALGLVIDATTVGTIDDATDTAIFTHVVSPPWMGSGFNGMYDVRLGACSSPTSSSAPCYNASDTGLFAADGTTTLGTFSATGVIGSSGGGAMAQFRLERTQADASSGFAIPAGSIARMALSLPTSGTQYGINFATTDFSKAAGNTGLKVNPGAPGSSSNLWEIGVTDPAARVLITIFGEARATSSAISRQNWYGNCQVTISGTTVTSTGCGEGMTSAISDTHMVVTTVPAVLGVSVSSNPVMQTVAGGLVSTNAQGMAFGAATMAGTAFEFAVAGPSYDASNSARSSDGFYYVCVPQAFLAGSFNTTPAAAASTWQGTRDGAVLSSGVTFSVGSCGLGSGLVAAYPSFGYSAPLFSVKPPAAPSSGSSSSTSSTATTTTTTTTAATTASTTPTSVPVTPTVAPVVYPNLSVGKSVAPSYLLKLADWTPSKNATVSISVPKMYRSACMVDDEGRVVAKKAGLCGVRIKVVSPQGKTFYKRVYLTTA